MANCEQNILDLPLRITPPATTDVIMITHTDGSTEIVAWSTILAWIAPTDIEFQVGDVGYAQAGDATYQNDAFINRRVRVTRGHVLQSTLDDGSGNYYSFNSVTGTITIHPNFSDDEIIQIQAY